MSPKVSFHETAESELNEAADFYELASPDLGRLLIDEIQRTVGRITEFPDSAPRIHGEIRKRSIARFPFSVIYSVHLNEIRILAIAHQRRRPFYWRGRR